MKRLAFALISLSLMTLPAHAAVFKCTAKNGRIVYTNDRDAGKNCTPVSTEQNLSTIPAFRGGRSGGGSVSSPSSFPRVSGEEQCVRDQGRRETLQSEMDEETRKLSAAKNELAKAQESNNTQPGSTSPEQLQQLEETVNQHQRNIDALQQELGKTN